MDDRIYEKLNEIKDLKDRVLLKQIMNSVFEALEEHSNNKVYELEKRVFSELPYIKEKYNVYSTIVKRDRYDVTEDFLFPMIKEDLEDKVYAAEEIQQSLEAKEHKNLFKIYIKGDYSTYKKFLEESFKLKGVIKTDKKTHEAYFTVAQNCEYKNIVYKLYKGFINSNIAWTTINNPYIHKFANVILTGCEDSIEEEENITSIEVDFQEYSEFIEYDMMPLWNVRELILKGDGFPIPCIDKVGYEHNISIEKEGINNGYLVDHENEAIDGVTFTKKAVVIASNIDKAVEWKLLSIIGSDKNSKKKYEHELMSNEVNINFSNKLAFDKAYTIKTKTELARLINSFKAAKYLNFKEVVLMEETLEEDKETYEVNDFIIDEIREDKIKKVLVLYFEPIDKENYLNKDILSFLVSEVQFIYPEYRCEGRLI